MKKKYFTVLRVIIFP